LRLKERLACNESTGEIMPINYFNNVTTATCCKSASNKKKAAGCGFEGEITSAGS
jgi:hypothetical protein